VGGCQQTLPMAAGELRGRGEAGAALGKTWGKASSEPTGLLGTGSELTESRRPKCHCGLEDKGEALWSSSQAHPMVLPPSFGPHGGRTLTVPAPRRGAEGHLSPGQK
jgi:hypothetical protein